MSGQINVDVIQTSAGPSLGAGNATLMKNRIINGAMVIDQRNNGASGTGTGVYTVDRWYYQGSQTGKFTWGQNLGSVTPPVGFTNYLGFSSSSAYSVSATDRFYLYQAIEGYNMADFQWGTANAKTVTLSAWVYSSLTGTFGGALQNSGATRNYPFSFSIPVANTWTQISVTIAGDTTGTWQTTNSGGIYVNFSLGAGSTVSGTAGAWSGTSYFSTTGATSVVGTNGATFYITGVQLEVGSSATSFEYRFYGHEEILCRRYFTNGQGDCVGYALSSTVAVVNTSFPVVMRVSPTITVSPNPYTESAWYQSVASGSGVYNSSHSNKFGAAIQIIGYTNLNTAFPVMVQGSYINFSAEIF